MLIQQTAWDYPYWPELDDDLANEVVMDFITAVGEYRQSLVHGFIVREEPVIGVYVVEQAELEQTISDLMRKLEDYDLSVYTVVETVQIKGRGGHKPIDTLVMHIRNGKMSMLRAPLKLSFTENV